jgi:hypothetical protein
VLASVPVIPWRVCLDRVPFTTRSTAMGGRSLTFPIDHAAAPVERNPTALPPKLGVSTVPTVRQPAGRRRLVSTVGTDTGGAAGCPVQRLQNDPARSPCREPWLSGEKRSGGPAVGSRRSLSLLPPGCLEREVSVLDAHVGLEVQVGVPLYQLSVGMGRARPVEDFGLHGQPGGLVEVKLHVEVLELPA